LDITRKDAGKRKQKPRLQVVLNLMSKCSLSSCLMRKRQKGLENFVLKRKMLKGI